MKDVIILAHNIPWKGRTRNHPHSVHVVVMTATSIMYAFPLLLILLCSFAMHLLTQDSATVLLMNQVELK